MEESPCSEAHIHLAGQAIPPRLSGFPKVHYRVHKSPPLDHILSQMNPKHALITYFKIILILSSLLCPDFPTGIFNSFFTSKH
jgi:hypothetical protein